MELRKKTHRSHERLAIAPGEQHFSELLLVRAEVLHQQIALGRGPLDQRGRELRPEQPQRRFLADERGMVRLRLLGDERRAVACHTQDFRSPGRRVPDRFAV